MNNKNFAVFDFETDSPNPLTTNPVQLACVMVSPRTLEIIPNSEFSSNIRPPDIDEKDYYENHKATIEWHAKNLNLKPIQVYENWKTHPEEKLVWNSFKEYLDKYHAESGRKSKFSAPIASGQNILRFDCLIIERLCRKYNDIDKQGDIRIFNQRDKLDLMNIFFLWFENNPEIESFSMDSMREYFNISTKGSHDAIKDVKDTALLLIKFLALHRRFATKVKFKGSCGGK